MLVAVILFGDRISHQAHRKKLTLTASTDNLGNTFVLSHFMSCKFPLSIVVMELAAQLRRYGMEMDLGWIPRGQNAEADALTNSEFEGFDLEKRITLNFEDLKFLVMDKLMRKAATLDEEIKLAKSSKEAKNDRPMDSRSKKEERTNKMGRPLVNELRGARGQKGEEKGGDKPASEEGGVWVLAKSLTQKSDSGRT